MFDTCKYKLMTVLLMIGLLNDNSNDTNGHAK